MQFESKDQNVKSQPKCKQTVRFNRLEPSCHVF